ncbi:uncharacterized protein METZ01_LOCUS140038, partial [marine metagenome]
VILSQATIVRKKLRHKLDITQLAVERRSSGDQLVMLSDGVPEEQVPTHSTT